jgi:hypothetical protein
MEKKNEVKETVSSNLLTFDCELMPNGILSLDRNKLVKFLETEHRSYANFPATMKDEEGIVENSFDIPELSKRYGKSGIKVGVTIHLADNASGKKQSKTRKAL